MTYEEIKKNMPGEYEYVANCNLSIFQLKKPLLGEMAMLFKNVFM